MLKSFTLKADSEIPQGVFNFWVYSFWLIIINWQDSASKLPGYFGILIFGIKYSKAVPDQETRPLYLFNTVRVLLNAYQCFGEISFLAMATILVCLASDASKS